MKRTFDWAWIERRSAETIDIWNACASHPAGVTRHYSRQQQTDREEAYDEALHDVEGELKNLRRNRTERFEIQRRIITLFARFSAAALDLEDEAIHALTNDFLPVGTQLARWARNFDRSLSMADIIQACRNAWTACGLQPLFGVPVELTPSILGYSLLYPYSDNVLDQPGLSRAAKLKFSRDFRRLLLGTEETASGLHSRETPLHRLIRLIESQYPRALYPDVYDCLLAIHRAQERSILQLSLASLQSSTPTILAISCAKGGSSVLADGCLAYGRLTEEESRFAFEWGVLLQLGDDLQDVREDIARGSTTLFSRAASSGEPLDSLASQLLKFSEHVAVRMDKLPHGSVPLKELLRMSWRSLVTRAIADAHEFFSPAFLEQMEPGSPFRFNFLRDRNQRLSGKTALYSELFDAFLDAPDDGATLPAGYNQEPCNAFTP